MIARLRIPVLFAAACWLAVPALGQFSTTVNPVAPGLADNNVFNYQQWPVVGQVKTLRGDPVAHARVEVMPANTGAEFRVLMTDLQGKFNTVYMLKTAMDAVKDFSFEVNVTKKGFLKAHALVDFSGSNRAWVIPITLRTPEEDPDLLPQADLISILAPKLSKLRTSDGLSAVGEKDYARGVVEFLEMKKPERALLYFTKVTHRDPSCLACQTMLGLAELASSDWDGAQRNFVEICQKMLSDSSPGRPEPFVALGVMQSWQYEPKEAAGYFVTALKYAPQDSLALQELGRSQLLVQNWLSAVEYLGKALAAGANPEVRLLYVEALMSAGQYQAANTEMARYLNGAT